MIQEKKLNGAEADLFVLFTFKWDILVIQVIQNTKTYNNCFNLTPISRSSQVKQMMAFCNAGLK